MAEEIPLTGTTRYRRVYLWNFLYGRDDVAFTTKFWAWYLLWQEYDQDKEYEEFEWEEDEDAEDDEGDS